MMGLPNWDAVFEKTVGLRAEMRTNGQVPAVREAAIGPIESDSAPTAPSWPAPIEPEGFHEIAGDFVRIVSPHSEADPCALLLQFLVAVGNVLGRSVFRIADGARHFLNLFVVIVGRTAGGRKGSSWAQVNRFLRLVDEEWSGNRVQGGLSSGEGLIWAVRDPIERLEPIKEKGRYTDEHQSVVIDHGVSDKRLLILESEFGAVLKVCARDGNTLSAIIRQGWDSGDLRTLTKNAPARATGAHVSVVGHIVRDELQRHLDSTDAANGFANRFLWILARRSKELPFGGDLRDTDLMPLAARLRDVIEWARRPRELEFDAPARDVWIAVYGPLSQGRAGLLGGVLGRAEAQVLRLACLYAALDASSIIKLAHLRAALAVWEYSVRSAEFIFGDRLGDPDADAILAALRSAPSGIARTGIRDLFGRNLTANRIERALASLTQLGLASFERVPTNGRPGEVWRATTKAPEASGG